MQSNRKKSERHLAYRDDILLGNFFLLKYVRVGAGM